jgi:hypothetical protein
VRRRLVIQWRWNRFGIGIFWGLNAYIAIGWLCVEWTTRPSRKQLEEAATALAPYYRELIAKGEL